MSSKLPLDAATNAFLGEIASFRGAYKRPVLYFIASIENNNFHVIRAMLVLGPVEGTAYPPELRTKRLFAGRVTLDSDIDAVLHSILNGRLRSPYGELLFDRFSETTHADFKPFDERGKSGQGRLTTLAFSGNGSDILADRPNIDWELRASERPFSDANDVLNEFSLNLLSMPGIACEVHATQVAMVKYDSEFSGTTAVPEILLAKSLDKSKVTVGFKITTPDRRIERVTRSGADLIWGEHTNNEALLIGKCTLEVPEGSIIQCFVSYDGLGIHYGWLRDTSTWPNSMRAIVELFDPDFEGTKKNADPNVGRGRSGRQSDLEHATCAVLWMLGFSTFPIGMSSNTSDAVDIIARTPGGHYLLVECTTGALKAQNKLANLQSRTARVRRTLASTWSSSSQVIPVIVTSLPREEVLSEIPAAQQFGIFVVTGDEILSYIYDRTLFPPNADLLFEEVAQAVGSKGREA